LATRCRKGSSLVSGYRSVDPYNNGFDWRSDQHLYVSVEVWSRQVVVTPEFVRIYADTPGT